MLTTDKGGPMEWEGGNCEGSYEAYPRVMAPGEPVMLGATPAYIKHNATPDGTVWTEYNLNKRLIMGKDGEQALTRDQRVFVVEGDSADTNPNTVTGEAAPGEHAVYGFATKASGLNDKRVEVRLAMPHTVHTVAAS